MKKRKQFSARASVQLCRILLVLLPVSVPIFSGCAKSRHVGVGPIEFTDANGVEQSGAHTSIGVGQTAYVDVAIANDTSLFGADWTAACGSALPPGTPLPPGQVEDESCGTFTPVHTASAPVPQYATSGSGIVTLFTAPASVPKTGVVTLYAAATADHSQYSSVTLTIIGQAISVGFVSPVPPSSLNAGETASFKAVVTNDSAAGGVNWTVQCKSSDCGSFNPAQTASGVATTYTAPSTVPSGSTVVVTAASVTDPTKSVSAYITIQQPL